MEWIAWVIAALATVNNIIHVWTGRAYNNKKDAIKEAQLNAALYEKIDNIAEKIDEIQTDMGAYSFKIDKIKDRLTWVEYLAKDNQQNIKELLKVNS
jgi:peptidoglycan hydrolase CwlO-like protein